MNFYNEFSVETQSIIQDFYDKQRRIRRSKIGNDEMKELLDFIHLLVFRYEEIAAMVEDACSEKIERNRRNIKNFKTKHEMCKKDYHKIERILSTNKYDASPKIIRLESGKSKKRFDVRSIEKISRVFYAARSIGTNCIIRLLEVPDIHFIITTIKKDEFGDLSKYMGNVLAS